MSALSLLEAIVKIWTLMFFCVMRCWVVEWEIKGELDHFYRQFFFSCVNLFLLLDF
jgi:hypothetical protein